MDRWWEGVRDQVMQPQRVMIGDRAENPMTLSACEWLDVFDATGSPTADREAVEFETELTAGPIELQTWMLDASGQQSCGAYYVYVERLR
jgi:hypothetical protein